MGSLAWASPTCGTQATESRPGWWSHLGPSLFELMLPDALLLTCGRWTWLKFTYGLVAPGWFSGASLSGRLVAVPCALSRYPDLACNGSFQTPSRMRRLWFFCVIIRGLALPIDTCCGLKSVFSCRDSLILEFDPPMVIQHNWSLSSRLVPYSPRRALVY